jgi:hypothetical protein
MSSPVETSEPTPTPTDDVIGAARLLLTLKEHNVTILLATLVAYQIGMLDKLWTYGSGMC